MSPTQKMSQRALETACALLILASITQGLQDLPLFHYKSKEVLVGQNASLPCYIENIGNNAFIHSIEWIENETQPRKLALYMSGIGYNFFGQNVTLKNITNGNDKLLGANLELPNVDNRDAGTYICSITAFPSGTVQKKIELRVKDKIECDMNSSIEVKSGENVTIHCSEFSNVAYTWSKNEEFVADGASLRLLSVSEASAGLYTLTADTGNRRLQATFTIKVHTQTTHYRADMTTPLPSSNSSSGRDEATSRSPTTEDATNSTTMIPTSYSQYTESQNTSTYTTTLPNALSGTTEDYNPPEANHTTQNYKTESTATVQNQHFNQSEAVSTDMSNYNHSGATTMPLVHNISTEYAENNDSGSAMEFPHDNFSKAFTSTTSAPNTTSGTAAVNVNATQASSPRSTTDVTVQQDPPKSGGQSHLVLTLSVIGAVFLIVVALMLYRRRVIKNRMDLPPPFKPPPPPIRYAPVRNPQQQFPTDRCNSVSAGGAVEMRLTFV